MTMYWKIDAAEKAQINAVPITVNEFETKHWIAKNRLGEQATLEQLTSNIRRERNLGRIHRRRGAKTIIAIQSKC